MAICFGWEYHKSDCDMPTQQRMCMRSKVWLAASVSLRLARLPPHKQSAALAAAPDLLTHGLVTNQ